MVELVEFVDGNGRNHFRRWLSGLDRTTQFRVNNVLARMANGSFPGAKGVGEGVLEVRLHFGAGIRIYYAHIEGRIVLLLLGGSKQRQDLDIALAHRLWKESKSIREEG